MKTYTAWGFVRGGCRHKHKSRATAEACAAKDRSDCRSLGGGSYGDRYAHETGCAAVRGYGKCDCPENIHPLNRQ